MSLFRWKKSSRRNSTAQRSRPRSNRLTCEPLESRRLLTLLGVIPTTPLITYDSTGHIQYTASSQTFDLTATPLVLVSPAPHPITAPRSLAIHIHVDNSGNLVSGTPGNDFEIDGTVDPDGAGPQPPVSGLLLTGEVNGFGFQEAGTTDLYDMRFTPTGGALLADFAGHDIGMTVASENSTFNNDFTVDFSGGAKGNIGNVPIPPRVSPTLVTTASPNGTITLDQSGSPILSDSADLEGAINPGGSITFTLSYNGNPVYSQIDTVSGNGIYDSGSYALPVNQNVAGSYVWTATYTGDGNNNPASDPGTSAAEQLTVNPANPKLVTTASPNGSIALDNTGSPVLSDSADLEGAYSPGGSIDFVLTLNGNLVYSQTDPVSSNGIYNSGSYTLPGNLGVTGNYVWTATYTGDGNNNSASDPGTSAAEQLTVNPASPTLVTVASAGGTVGVASVSDTATLSGGYNETGNLTFTLLNSSDLAVFTDTEPVSGDGSVTSASFTPTAADTYHWVVSYAGDDNNNSASDPGTSAAEQVTITKASPDLVTTASAGGTVGSASVSDIATLSGGYNETGNITFTLENSSNAPVFTDTEPASGDGSVTSVSFTPTAVDTYHWVVSYAGDGNNNPASDPGTSAAEQVTISPASPTLITTASFSAGNVLGSAIPQDMAVLSGGYHESGTITFTLKAPDSTIVDTEMVTPNGDGTYTTSNANVATQVGTYTWTVTYAGDGLNNPANDQGGAAEQVTTVKASPTVITTASFSAGNVVGSAIPQDMAVLSGGYHESGTITFTLKAPDNTIVDTEMVTPNGDGTYTTSNANVATQVGTYTWTVTYAGDGLNNPANDQGGAAEQVTTVKASPTVTTTPGCTVMLGSGAKLTDSATVSGGYGLTGTLTFTLYGPSNMVVDTEMVAVSGNGSYSTPTGYLPTAAGTYQWVASYSGDGKNNSFSSHKGDEPEVVTPSGTINGTKYLDVTGNGLTPDDTGMSNVKIYLDANNDGSWESNEPYQITAANGTYSFTGLASGTYIVREVVPSGFVRTNPTLSDKYTVNLASGGTASGNNFANAERCDETLTSVVYVIDGMTAVSDLRGNTAQGDTVEVSFTVPAGQAPHSFTLVSYTAPGPTFVASQAGQQQIFDIDTGVFGPGSYTLTVTIPHSYYQVDFVCGNAIDHFGPEGSNIFYSAQGRLFSADNGGTCAPLTNGGSLSGFVFVDANSDGKIQPTERVVSGALVKLTGTDSSGHSVSQSSLTDYNGLYMFDNLAAGTYTITETQSGDYTDGADCIGSIGGAKQNDKFTSIVLGTNVDGINYNFGEQQVTGAAVAGNQTANVAFWSSNSGQTLIKALNGSSTATALSGWLVSNYGNMYGSTALTNNLTGKTNAQVASYFQTLASTSSKKLEADTLALALNVYVTKSSLAGTVASSYGFAVSTNGLGAATVSVGSSGAAFGVEDNAVLTVSDLLYLANIRACNGTLWDTNDSGSLSAAELILRAEAFTLFDNIDNT